MQDATDGELVLTIGRAGAHAAAAEAELCRRFVPRARLYGLRHLRDEASAWDLAQTCLVVVIEAARAGRIREVDHVDRFVLGTCRNLASRFRHAAAKVEPTDHELLEAIGVAPPDLEHVDAAALHRCLATLTERARTVLLLTYQEDRSADDIGRALELTAGNVRVVRHRAIDQLRRCLDAPREVA